MKTYGLHTWKDMKFLHQDNLITSPAGVPSPFNVENKTASPTNIIPRDHGVELNHSELVKFFYPIPWEIPTIKYLPAKVPGAELFKLLQISGVKEAFPNIFPLWSYNPKPEHFNITNLAPIVFYDGTNADQKTIQRIASLASMGTRNVLFVGEANTMFPGEEILWEVFAGELKHIGEQVLFEEMKG